MVSFFLTKFIFYANILLKVIDARITSSFKIYGYMGTIHCVEIFVKFLVWFVFFYLFALFLKPFNGNHLCLFLLCTAYALTNYFSQENILFQIKGSLFFSKLY